MSIQVGWPGTNALRFPPFLSEGFILAGLSRLGLQSDHNVHGLDASADRRVVLLRRSGSRLLG